MQTELEVLTAIDKGGMIVQSSNAPDFARILSIVGEAERAGYLQDVYRHRESQTSENVVDLVSVRSLSEAGRIRLSELSG